MASNQQFCLRWNNHQSTLISVFDHLLESGTLVDCTLAAEGQFLKAHKVVLSACSPYLEAILSQHYEKHPILILKDVTFHELKSMLDYMYRGEVNISQEQLGTFLKAAESLQIKGLTDNGAMSENRDFDRSRDLEPSRLDRTMGAFPKRMDMRKQIPILPRSRSPLVGLPPNMMINSDFRRSNKHPLLHEESSTNSHGNKSREGSVSPTAKRKRSNLIFVPPIDSNVAITAPNNHENNHEENHQKENKSKESSPVPPNLLNSLPSSVPGSKLLVDSEKPEESEVVMKREVKSENVDFSDEVHNDDSVEDLTVDEEEEEEMDEMDLSKPGPSNVSNSHVAGVPWHVAGEGNGEDLLLASQQDSQGGTPVGGGRKITAPLQHVPSWEVWSALHPTVPNLLRGALSYSSAPASEEPKGVECPKCGRHYKLKSSLRNHQKWECGKEPQFQCPYCNYRAKQKMHVARHIERMHREKLDMLESIHERPIKEDTTNLFQQDTA